MIRKISCRILCLIVCVVLSLSCICAIFVNGNSKKVFAQERKITVISCEDYIDEELLTEFTEKTGIEVDYITKGTPEDMYNEISKDINACNLVCPSEYMIMKMMGEDMIKSFSTPENFSLYGSKYIKETFKNLGIKDLDGNLIPMLSENEQTTYAVGYMWGTMGYIYNQENGLTAEDLKNWDVISEKKFNRKSTIKDSIRDTYIMAVGAVYKDELLALDKTDPDYNKRLTEIFNRTDDDTLLNVEVYLQNLRQNIYGFEVDSGKSDIVTGKIDVNFAWSGDAVCSLDDGDSVGVSLGYAVPEEGSNVWFDGFVMTKNTSGQVEQDCITFLNYLCDPEIVVRNMEYIGYTSCIAGDAVWNNVLDWYNSFESEVLSEEDYNQLQEEEKSNYTLCNNQYIEKLVDDDETVYYAEYVYDEDKTFIQYYDIIDGEKEYGEKEQLYLVDLKYFFDPDCVDDSYVVYSLEEGRQLYAQYADEETINRCAIMDNFDAETLEKVSQMWNRVKLTTLPTWAIILITCVLVLLVVGVIILRYGNKIFYRKKNK